MRIHNEGLILSNTDMTSDIVSNPIWLGHIANFAIQLVFTGSGINGTFKLQASNDNGAKTDKIEYATVDNWTDIKNSSQIISSAGDHMWNVQNCGYRWVRVVWTDSSSSNGNLDSARFNVKGV